MEEVSSLLPGIVESSSRRPISSTGNAPEHTRLVLLLVAVASASLMGAFAWQTRETANLRTRLQTLEMKTTDRNSQIEKQNIQIEKLMFLADVDANLAVRQKRLEAEAAFYPAPEGWGEMTRVGTEYGGYPIFMKRMNADAKIFSFGLGADVSFDVALMKASGATVHGFDNTPKHMEWWQKEGKASIPADLKFEHHELLLGVEDGTLKLQLPTGHGTSYAPGTSSKQGFQDGTEVELPAKSLASLLQEHNVEQLEVIKIDVEGAEWALLESWTQQFADKGLPACQLMIEFHQRLVDGDGAAVKAKAVKNLETLGFQLAHHVDKEDGADDNLFINTKVCK